MARLIVQDVQDEVVQALEERAARHGRSVESEHREILREALAPTPGDDAKAVLLEMPDVGADTDFERVRDVGRRLDS